MILTSTLFRCPTTPTWTRPAPARPLDTFLPTAQADTGIYSPKMLPPSETQKAYDKAMARFGKIPGVQISVSASDASGGRPVVTVRHQGADPKNLTVHTHFHGFQVYDKKVGYDDKIAKTVENAWGKDKNQVFVFPEAQDEANPGYHAEWGNIASVHDLTKTAVEKAGLKYDGVQKTVLSGHSAGGTPVAKALARAQDGQDGPFTRVELYDAAVQSQGTAISRSERAGAEAYARSHDMLYVPGTMSTSWEGWIPQRNQTKRVNDHFEAVWASLGQARRASAARPVSGEQR